MNVYKLIDGKLVPVPGNQRNPKRRYKNTSDSNSGERYYLEFTDDEEAQRDEEEAEYKARRPQREAERIENERKQQEFRNSIKYQSRVVAFLDILGWKTAIEKSQYDAEYIKDLGVSLQILESQCVATNKMRGFVEDLGNQTLPGDPRLTQFSDCLVLSASPDYSGIGFMVSSIKFICSSFLQRGLLIRGGIVLGDMYHRDNSLFGPALVEAHRLESKEAKVPRIILQKELADSLGKGDKYLNKDGSLIGYAKTWRKSEDGWSFFDYLQPFLNSPDHQPAEWELKHTLKKARNLATMGLDELLPGIRTLT